MYYQNLMINALRYVQRQKRINLAVTSLRRNMFTNHPRENVRRTICYSNHKFYEQRRMTPSISTGVFIAGIFSFFKKEEDEDPTSEIVMTIKRAILLIQKEEFTKAEQMLHVALRQAQTLQHYDGVTYVYDVMANLAFDLKDYKKAETLFVAVLQRLMARETSQDDLRVVHISLKIAKIYQETAESQKAENGYKFCIEKLRSCMKKDGENEDVEALLGLTLESYSSLLFTQERYVDALKYLYEAYDLHISLHGEEHEQTIILLNDLGAANCMTGQYDKAIEHLTKAEAIGRKFPDMVDLGAIHVNLGNAYIKKGMLDEARKFCNEGKRIAKFRKDKDGLLEAEICIDEIKKLTS